MLKQITLFVVILFTESMIVDSRIYLEKLERQFDPLYAEITSKITEVNGESVLDIDAQSLFDGDDIMLHVAIFSKIDGQYNVIAKPDPIHVCKVHDLEDPMIQFIYKQMEKFGNITTACPPKKGHYYVHGFTVKEIDFPLPLPYGEFRLDLNSSFMDNGVEKKIAYSELFFKTAM